MKTSQLQQNDKEISTKTENHECGKPDNYSQLSPQNKEMHLNETKIQNETKFPAPLMINPTEIDQQEVLNDKENQKENNNENNNLITIENEDLKIPYIQEFDILKNKDGIYAIKGGNEDQIEIKFENEIPALRNKNKSNSYTPNKKEILTKQEIAKQQNRLYNKQLTHSIVIDQNNNGYPQPNQGKKINHLIINVKTKDSLNDLPQSPKKIKKQMKVRIPLLSLANERPMLALTTMNSNLSMKSFSETDGYHDNSYCCEMLYEDDCYLKQTIDLLFQLFYLPIRFIIFILRFLYACCIDDDEEEQENLGKENIGCHVGCYNCFYCPFKCCGDWFNQCNFSRKKFLCQGLSFLPEKIISLLQTNNLKCLLQCGMFLKNCCFFPSNIKWVENFSNCCCLKPFHLLGECLQSMCTPQGICEMMFIQVKKLSCSFINPVCINKIFCCFTKQANITCKNGKLITLSYCCGWVIETDGETSKIEENL